MPHCTFPKPNPGFGISMKVANHPCILECTSIPLPHSAVDSFNHVSGWVVTPLVCLGPYDGSQFDSLSVSKVWRETPAVLVRAAGLGSLWYDGPGPACGVSLTTVIINITALWLGQRSNHEISQTHQLEGQHQRRLAALQSRQQILQVLTERRGCHRNE